MSIKFEIKKIKLNKILRDEIEKKSIKKMIKKSIKSDIKIKQNQIVRGKK